MASLNAISPTNLLKRLGSADAPHVVDVRLEEDFSPNPRSVPSARRIAHERVAEIAERVRERGAVVVCEGGRKLSQGAAAILRAARVEASYLEGGMAAWRQQKLPSVSEAAIPPRGADGATLWVTRHRPKIDRIACPWLIRRFVDTDARFLFVAPSEVEAVAARFDATPFDVEDVRWSHRGERCTFDVMLAEFGLETEPLLRLARVVRAADTNRHDLAPEAAGLLAVSVGLSRLHRDDLAQLDAGMTLYDALYRWARDAHDEGHDWPNP